MLLKWVLHYTFHLPTADSVKSANADFVGSKQKSCKPYLVETFDVKVTCVEGGSLDVRLLVKRKEHGDTKLRVLLVKKNDIKDVTFDVVNLHRYNYFNSMSSILHPVHFRLLITGSMMYV